MRSTPSELISTNLHPSTPIARPDNIHPEDHTPNALAFGTDSLNLFIKPQMIDPSSSVSSLTPFDQLFKLEENKNRRSNMHFLGSTNMAGNESNKTIE